MSEVDFISVPIAGKIENKINHSGILHPFWKDDTIENCQFYEGNNFWKWWCYLDKLKAINKYRQYTHPWDTGQTFGTALRPFIVAFFWLFKPEVKIQIA